MRYQSILRFSNLPPFYVWPCAIAALAACSSTVLPHGEGGESGKPTLAPAATHKSFLPASVHAMPDAQCDLHPASGAEASHSVHLTTGGDGLARFHAARATATDVVKALVLTCQDRSGTSAEYTVDLLSEQTFAPKPWDVSKEPGVDRPPLKGDPLAYSQLELLEAGYGPRPDPATDASEYARWLDEARRPARLLRAAGSLAPRSESTEVAAVSGAAPKPARVDEVRAEGSIRPDNTLIAEASSPWVGAVLTGAANYDYTIASFVVPTGIPEGDHMGDSSMTIWNGLGGFGTSGGLIQGGITIQMTPFAASYSSFREYCCGQSVNNSFQGFKTFPGDLISTEEWYCDAQGNVNINGGYGCSRIKDLTQFPIAIVECIHPNDPSCASVPALPSFVIGNSAEFIAELPDTGSGSAGHGFPDFTTFTMQGSAHPTSGAPNPDTVTTDPFVTMLTDFTSTPSHVNVAFANGGVTFSNSLQPSPFRDVNLDGQFDFLWHNPSTGETQAWFMSGTDRVSFNSLHDQATQTPLNVSWPWSLVGSGDINYDGFLDLIWQSAITNEFQVWFMSGTDRTGFNSITDQATGALLTAPSPWALGAVGTFGGGSDRRTDLALYNTQTGECQVWLMNGTTRTGFVSVTDTSGNVLHASPGWVLATAADFNLDGQDDLVWHDTSSGQTQVWFMNGTQRIGFNSIKDQPTQTVLTLTAPWVLRGAGLIDHDDRPDLVWTNTSSNQTVVWFMSGTDRIGNNSLHDQATQQVLQPAAPWSLTAE